MKRNRVFLLAIILVLSVFPGCNDAILEKQSKELNMSEFTPFGISYSKIEPGETDGYNLIILEPDLYTRREIMELKQSGTKVLAYLSLGEVHPGRWYFPQLEQFGFAGKNLIWGSYYLNLENENVQSFIIDRVVPEIMLKGVDGLFLDTVDAVADYTDRKYMQPNMIHVIQSLKKGFPEAFVMQNAGFFILDETSDHIDAALIEDVASAYNFDKELYQVRDSIEFKSRIEMIREVSERHNISVFIVDFSVNEKMTNDIRQMLDSYKFPYFISNIELNRLPNDPLRVSNTLKR